MQAWQDSSLSCVNQILPQSCAWTTSSNAFSHHAQQKLIKTCDMFLVHHGKRRNARSIPNTCSILHDLPSQNDTVRALRPYHSVSSSGQRHHHSMNAAKMKCKGRAGWTTFVTVQYSHTQNSPEKNKVTKCVLQQLHMSSVKLLTQDGASWTTHRCHKASTLTKFPARD